MKFIFSNFKMAQIVTLDKSGKTKTFGVRLCMLIDTKSLESEPHGIKSHQLKTKDKTGQLHTFRLQIIKSTNSYNLNILLGKSSDDLYSHIIFGLCDETGKHVNKCKVIDPKFNESLKSYLPFHLVSHQELKDLCYSCNKLFLNFFMCDHSLVSGVNHVQQSSLNVSETEASCDSQILKDFGSLYDSSTLSDFKILTHDKEFKVHKNILAARSSVFATKFIKDCQGNNGDNDRMVIEAKSEVVDEMLRYIYTGSTQKLSQFATTLYELGKQYGLQDLQEECVNSMNENLSINNAIPLLVFAKTHKIPDLQRNVADFFSRHAREIVFSDISSDTLNSLLHANLS